MSEAFECFICRKVMALFGADPSRCPGCGSIHGKLLTRAHIDKKLKVANSAGRRPKKK